MKNKRTSKEAINLELILSKILLIGSIFTLVTTFFMYDSFNFIALFFILFSVIAIFYYKTQLELLDIIIDNKK